MAQKNPQAERIVRAHDITLCLERNSVPEFENLHLVGMATRLALHLRGVQPVAYELIKSVAIYLLDFPTTAVRPVLQLLEEAEFLQLVTEGTTIKTVIPKIPYYEKLFDDLGEVSSATGFSEHEQFALELQTRLAGSPLVRESVYQLGADKSVVDRIITLGCETSFLSAKRARGRDVILSPTYFSESPTAYADLVAGHGAGRVKRILELLQQNQGWPMSLILSSSEIAGTKLLPEDIAVFKLLAREGFAPPPAIVTEHAGTNHFLFGPRPYGDRIPAFKRPIFEAAMALVAAVRQGQLLPAQYRIRSPYSILRKLKEEGFIGANSEALEQYRQVAALRVGKLVKSTGSRYRLELVRTPENLEAVTLAMEMVSGENFVPEADQEIVIALRSGESYVESLLGRKRLMQDRVVALDEETQSAIDAFLLKGAK